MEIKPVLGRLGHYGAICLSIALVACGGGGSSGSPDADEQNTSRQTSAGTPADDTMAILESIYLNRRIPDGFYSETEPDPGVFQTIAHIKNTDIAEPSSITPETPRYELCADNFDQALQWSIDTAADSGELVDNRDTALFFEFTRVPSGTPDFQNLQRVFKCSIADRSDIDLNHPEPFLGLYTELPQSVDNIKLLIEYLWSFSDSNNYGHAVLSSTTDEADTHYVHILEQARLTTAGELDAECDRIDVYATRYRIDKLTGSISVSESHQQAVSARYESGQISICGK